MGRSLSHSWKSGLLDWSGFELSRPKPALPARRRSYEDAIMRVDID